MNTSKQAIHTDLFSKSYVEKKHMLYPASTYRIQLNKWFTFTDLKNQIEYLHALGITTIYAAPITKAVTDSVHGYDVTDSSQINPQIGTLDDLKNLSDELKKYGMTWIQDIVPNHMAVSHENIRFTDTLERGNQSPYYTYFDINWNHPDSIGKVMLPDLGNELGTCIDNGEINLLFSKDGFQIQYFDHVYPLSISAIPVLLSVMEGKKLHEDFMREIKSYKELATSKNVQEWIKNKHTFYEHIQNDENYVIQAEWLLRKINKDKQLLKSLMQQQYYMLAHWKTAETKMNYRRFFTINNLICLRMEDADVFNDYHTFISFLYKEKLIQGVRIDHIDGLYDPLQYVTRLRNLLGEECYIIAEKILDYNEDLAKDWNIEGTSGYEFLSFTNRVLTDRMGAENIRNFYFEFIGKKDVYTDMVYEKKHTFLYDQMQGELDNLMLLLNELHLLPTNTDTARFRKALGAFMSAFPIYRIYPDRLPLSAEAFKMIQKAYVVALEKESELQYELDAIKNFFVYEHETCELKLRFIRRLMQFTGPLAAKGVEDTTFYIYNPLISHNEVGDAPSELGVTVDAFHEKMISRLVNNPFSLNATSTHDTKRGEDARMRINVLSHIPEDWKAMVLQWHEENRPFIKILNNRTMPSLNDEYFIYQSLLGSFPEALVFDDSYLERSKNFILKALKEAKAETSYTAADTGYEEACVQFIYSILNPEHPFLITFIPFIENIINHATVYSLSQTVIKVTAPGIPDIYQGSELWELSYVDPDNRRKVDYAFRNDLLNRIIDLDHEGTHVIDFIKQKRSVGAEKLFTTWKMLQLRKEWDDVFMEGDYIPLYVALHPSKKAIAYLRSHEHKHVLVIIPLGFDNRDDIYSPNLWNDILVHIPQGLSAKWKNIFTNEEATFINSITIANACKQFPVAVFKSL